MRWSRTTPLRCAVGLSARGHPRAVHVWHGMHDAVVPIDDAMHLVAELPRVQAALHPDEGHFFYRRRLQEILGDLVACVGAVDLRRARGECAKR